MVRTAAAARPRDVFELISNEKRNFKYISIIRITHRQDEIMQHRDYWTCIEQNIHFFDGELKWRHGMSVGWSPSSITIEQRSARASWQAQCICECIYYWTNCPRTADNLHLKLADFCVFYIHICIIFYCFVFWNTECRAGVYKCNNYS